MKAKPMLEMSFLFNFKVLNYLHLEKLIGPTGKNLFFFFNTKLADSENPKKKSQDGREKVSNIMYLCGTREFHPVTRIMLSETRLC